MPEVLHIGQATYYRTWWLLPTAALCGVGELLGWGGRLWSSISTTASTPFLIQSVHYILDLFNDILTMLQNFDFDHRADATLGCELYHSVAYHPTARHVVLIAHAQVV